MFHATLALHVAESLPYTTLKQTQSVLLQSAWHEMASLCLEPTRERRSSSQAFDEYQTSPQRVVAEFKTFCVV
jgi:hypothetical protein